MKQFTKYAYTRLERNHKLENFSSLFVLPLQIQQRNKYGLTLTCYDQTDGLNDTNEYCDDDDENKEHNVHIPSSNDQKKGMIVTLRTFQLLTKIARQMIIDSKTEHDDEVIQIGNLNLNIGNIGGEENNSDDQVQRFDSFDDLPMFSGDSELEEDPEVQILRDAAQSTTAVPLVGVDEEEEERVSFRTLMGRKSSNTDEDSSDEEDGEDGDENPRKDNESDEHVYLFKNDDIIFLVLPLYNDILTDENIRNEFGKYYGGEKRKKFKDPKLLRKFLSGMNISDFDTANREWLSSYNITPNNMAIFPNEMFTIKKFVECLEQHHKYYKEDQNNDDRCSFFTGDPDHLQDNEAKELFDRIQTNTIQEFYIPYQSWKINLSSFTYNSLEDNLLPWLKPHISRFFLKHHDGESTAMYSEDVMKGLKSAMPFDNTLRKQDPIDYLKKYVMNIKTRSLNGRLSQLQKEELLELLEYVFETPKLTDYYSIFNRALKSYITARRREYKGKFKVIGGVIELCNQRGMIKKKIKAQRRHRKYHPYRSEIEEDDDVDEDEDEGEGECDIIENLDPLSRFLFVGQLCISKFDTIPREYAGFTIVNPIIWADSQFRLSNQHFHCMCVGRGGVGKNHVINRSKRMVPPFTALEINDESEKAKTSDQPQNGGIVIQNEADPCITHKADKLSMADRKKQADVKEILSSSKYNYNVLLREHEPGKPEKRNLRFVQTSLETCRMWSANKVTNRGEALHTRFFVKVFFESNDARVVESMVRSETIPRDLKNPELIDITHQDLYTIQSIANIAMSVGIIEPPTLGIGSQIIHEVLNDMCIDGLDNTGSGRNYKRVLMAARQFTIVDPIIEKYMCTNEVKSFNYKDLISLECEFYLKKKHLFLATGHLSEQYMDPVKFLTIRTIFKYHLQNIDLFSLRMTSNDDAVAYELYTDRIALMKKYGNTSTIKTKMGTNGVYDNSLPDVLSQSQLPPPVMGELGYKDKYVKTHKRKSNHEVPWIEQTKQNIIAFYKTLIKFDKLLQEMKRTRHEFREYTNEEGETYYNLNYIRISSPFYRKRIIEEIKQQMPEKPMPEDVDYQFEQLGKMEHVIPVYLNTISSAIEIEIADMYDTNNPNRPKTKKERIQQLYEKFRLRCQCNKTKRLLEISQKPKDDGGCYIYVHHSLTNGVDPWIIVNSLKSKIENANTIPQTIFTAIPTKRIDPYSDRSDLDFVQIKPAPQVKQLEFVNMNFMNEDVIGTRKKMDDVFNKRKNTTGNRFGDNGVSEPPNTINPYNKVRDKKIYIREDLDIYFKKQRIEDLNLDTQIEIM